MKAREDWYSEHDKLKSVWRIAFIPDPTMGQGSGPNYSNPHSESRGHHWKTWTMERKSYEDWKLRAPRHIFLSSKEPEFYSGDVQPGYVMVEMWEWVSLEIFFAVGLHSLILAAL